MAIIVRTKGQKDALETQNLFAVGPWRKCQVSKPAQLIKIKSLNPLSPTGLVSLDALERVNHDPPLAPTQIDTSKLGAPTPRVPPKT